MAYSGDTLISIVRVSNSSVDGNEVAAVVGELGRGNVALRNTRTLVSPGCWWRIIINEHEQRGRRRGQARRVAGTREAGQALA